MEEFRGGTGGTKWIRKALPSPGGAMWPQKHCLVLTPLAPHRGHSGGLTEAGEYVASSTPTFQVLAPASGTEPLRKPGDRGPGDTVCRLLLLMPREG